jgi:thiamine-phosphate pyrophosphorylase
VPGARRALDRERRRRARRARRRGRRARRARWCAAARAIVGPARVVGASCYDALPRAVDAVAEGADYVAFGSFFASGTKPGARRAGLDLVPRARALGVPIVAIGGIDADNARELVDAGVDAVAVIGAVFAHDDPRDVTAAARRIAAVFAPREGVR